jgi:hypothetical protein
MMASFAIEREVVSALATQRLEEQSPSTRIDATRKRGMLLAAGVSAVPGVPAVTDPAS